MYEMKNARVIAVIIELNKGLWPLPLGFWKAVVIAVIIELNKGLWPLPLGFWKAVEILYSHS